MPDPRSRSAVLVLVLAVAACGHNPPPRADVEPARSTGQPDDGERAARLPVLQETPAQDPASRPPPRALSTVDTSDRQPLILEGDESVVLEGGTHYFERVCVQDRARIGVADSATIVLTSSQTSVIGGRGIGPAAQRPATIRIESQEAPDVFVLFDNQDQPVDFQLHAPRSSVAVAITGKTGLTISGSGAKNMTSYAAWGLPPEFPACDAQMDREPLPSFPPSVHIAENCGASYESSNYVQQPPAEQDAEFHVVGVYEGFGSRVEVHVAEAAKPVVLALTAYRGTEWHVTTGPGVRIERIYVSGWEPQTQTVSAVSANVPVTELRLGTYAYAWEPEGKSKPPTSRFQTAIHRLREHTGLVESSFQGCYAGKRFEVPHARL